MLQLASLAAFGRVHRLRDLAFDLHRLADDCTITSRSRERAEMLIAEGERIAAEVRAEFR